MSSNKCIKEFMNDKISENNTARQGKLTSRQFLLVEQLRSARWKGYLGEDMNVFEWASKLDVEAELIAEFEGIMGLVRLVGEPLETVEENAIYLNRMNNSSRRGAFSRGGGK